MATSLCRFLRFHQPDFQRIILNRYYSGTWTKDKMDNLVKEKKVVVFMKGVPDAPRCGFSNAVVQVLKMHGVDDYDSYNVLEDDELRQAVKSYSDWPTVPQVFLDGEFLGGCDILVDMHKNGELIDELKKAGIISALLEEPAKS